MQDKDLLRDLLEAENEDAALAALAKRGLLSDESRWRALGGMRNNQSIVHNQQSTATAALIEKFTNGLDAILLRRCKAAGVDPRDKAAPQTMAQAVLHYFGDLGLKSPQEIRGLAEESLLLYATGSKARPCLSLYDAGEGQLPENFPSTFCSLIYGSNEGSYKGAVPFVQGRFNMGGTGVLPFCSDNRKLQLIVSRVPDDVVQQKHDWGFTIFCFFPSLQSPEWRYLVSPGGDVLTADDAPLALVPKAGAKSGEVCKPRERLVMSGTLIKMYDYKAPRSNICGELFKKVDEYLLRPSLPLRIVECRQEYKANVMGVTVWDRLAALDKSKLEAGFEDGASIQLKLNTGEVVPAEIRVFKAAKGVSADTDHSQTGLRALINGQSHARRDAQFFRTKAVDKEHIAGSLLVTLDCTELGQSSRNALFMSNRETFREDPLLTDLFKKLQRELRDHEGLIELNQRRYEEKIADATSDNDGISALEELLTNDPALAELFGSMMPGRTAAKTLENGPGTKVKGTPIQFVGTEYPSYFKRANGDTAVQIELPRGGDLRVSFQTDVRNNYFTRTKHKGLCAFEGEIEPTFHLFNGRLTFAFRADKKLAEGAAFTTQIVISDNAGHGPFKLTVKITIGPPLEKKVREPKTNDPATDSAPSRPDIVEVLNGPDDPPITIQGIPGTKRLQLVLNKGSHWLDNAREMRPEDERMAVEFVFKYGLALIAMGLIDASKKSGEWEADEDACRKKIESAAAGAARVIVPLCLTLPQKLPKAA